MLDQADAWDDELARGACDQVAATAPAEGGAVSSMRASTAGRARWWQPSPARRDATGQTSGRRSRAGWSIRGSRRRPS